MTGIFILLYSHPLETNPRRVPSGFVRLSIDPSGARQRFSLQISQYATMTIIIVLSAL